MHKAKKRFGQNFLTDRNIIDKIVQSVDPKQDEHIVEIGPGLGAITEYLVHRPIRYDAIELDKDLIEHLTNKFSSYSGFNLHNIDILKFDLSSLLQNNAQDKKLRIVGNLPYNISTPLLFKLYNFGEYIDLHVMLQLEVAKRIAAKPGSKDYGRLSIMSQFYCDVIYLFDVPPGAFNPPPKVKSSFIRLKPKQNKLEVDSVELLEKIVTTAFTKRRKTVSNALKPLCQIDELKQAGIDIKLRPENIALEEYVNLANIISKKEQ